MDIEVCDAVLSSRTGLHWLDRLVGPGAPGKHVEVVRVSEPNFFSSSWLNHVLVDCAARPILHNTPEGGTAANPDSGRR